MTLDALLRKDMTTEVKDGGRTISPNYNFGKFLQFDTYTKELEALDIRTAEGIAKYENITGDDRALYSDEKLGIRKKSTTEHAREVLARYSAQHFDNLVGELDESTQMGLAVSSCPGEDREGAPEYNAVRKKVKATQETLKGIKENRDEFFSDIMAKEDSPMVREALTNYKDEYLQVVRGEAERAGVLAIAHYGVEKFLGETKTHIGTQAETLMTKKKELETLINQKRNDSEVEKKRVLTATESAKLFAEEYKQMETLSTDYADARTFEQLIETTSSLAITAIREKTERDKAEKEKREN